MARVSARVIFVCRVVLRETLSVAWRERGTFGKNPLSRLRRQLSRRESPWQRGQVSSSFVNGRKKPAVKLQTFRLCQSLSLSGEVARRSRDGEGCLPGQTLSVAYGDSSPKGRALGKEGKFRPHSSTAGGSQPISGKLFAFAKASPFRERWHGKAVTERVAFWDEPSQSPTATAVPLFVAYRRHLPPAGGSLSTGAPLAKRAGLVLIRQRQEEVSR